jgi:KUP system potassium uptake protein
MVSVVAMLVWRLPFYVVLPVFLVFAALDGTFMTAVLTKVPEGAWFTLVLAFILASVFIIWRFGKEAQWSAEAQDQLEPSAVLSCANGSIAEGRLSESFGGTSISVVPGLGVFFDKTGDFSLLPASFAHFVRKFAARPRVLIFFHMRPLSVPHIEKEEQVVVRRVPAMTNCYSVVLRHGYADDALYPGMAKKLVRDIERSVSKLAESGSAELQALQDACNSQIVYVLGKETMKINHPNRFSLWQYFRMVLLETFLWIRENTRAKLANMKVEADQLIEVGFLTEL